MRRNECSGRWGRRTGDGSPLEDGQFVARLEADWGPLLGSESYTCLFGRGVLWLVQWKALVWEVRREV